MSHEPPALLLESFRVRMYRSIRDSGSVPVFPLTALVGRPPSGKTSLLHALRGLDPTVAAPYSLQRDWPRGSRQQRAARHVVCYAAFRFGDHAREELLRKRVIDPGARGLRLARSYDGTLFADTWSDDRRAEDPPSDETLSSPRPRLLHFAREHLPTFLYADHDAFLPGALAADALADPGAGDGEACTAALAKLLKVVGVGREELLGEPSPRRIREAGEKIRDLLGRLGGHHDLALDAARGRVLVSLKMGGVRTAADQVSKELRYGLALDLRLAAATGGQGGQHTLLLLDAPGRAFRKKGRTRMRERFESYVRAGATVLYTSRLPFEIELQHPEQVLVLEPTSEGAMVARGTPDSGERLALRAALGMTGRTSFSVDDLNLVVEGPSDALILHALDELLRRSGEPGLPPEVNVMSAQGSFEVATVSAFLARQGLAVIALLDSDSAGFSAIEKLRRDLQDCPRRNRVEVLQLAEAAGFAPGSAAIEDLFPIDFYLGVALGVCGREEGGWIQHTLAGDEVRESGNPAYRLSRAFEAKGRHFPKGEVTEALEARLSALGSVAELPPGMVGPVRQLMRRIRSAAERLRVQPHRPGG